MDTNDLGILVLTTHTQFRFIKSCLESYKKINPKMIVCTMEIPLGAKDINNFIVELEVILKSRREQQRKADYLS